MTSTPVSEDRTQAETERERLAAMHAHLELATSWVRGNLYRLKDYVTICVEASGATIYLGTCYDQSSESDVLRLFTGRDLKATKSRSGSCFSYTTKCDGLTFSWNVYDPPKNEPSLSLEVTL